jgi:hypothetical protein
MHNRKEAIMKKLTQTLLYTGVAALAFTLPMHARPSREAAKDKHCVAKLQRVAPDAALSQIADLSCYPTFSDAIFAATEGAVFLPSKETLKEQLKVLNRELNFMKATPTPGAPYVIAVDYWDANYRGTTMTYTAYEPCSSTVWYELPSMPAGWNDVTSSSLGYSSCDQNIQYEHENFIGAVLTCTPNCAGFGALNDRISARRWFD